MGGPLVEGAACRASGARHLKGGPSTPPAHPASLPPTSPGSMAARKALGPALPLPPPPDTRRLLTSPGGASAHGSPARKAPGPAPPLLPPPDAPRLLTSPGGASARGSPARKAPGLAPPLLPRPDAPRLLTSPGGASARGSPARKAPGLAPPLLPPPDAPRLLSSPGGAFAQGSPACGLPGGGPGRLSVSAAWEASRASASRRTASETPPLQLSSLADAMPAQDCVDRELATPLGDGSFPAAVTGWLGASGVNDDRGARSWARQGVGEGEEHGGGNTREGAYLSGRRAKGLVGEGWGSYREWEGGGVFGWSMGGVFGSVYSSVGCM
ncbi:uncharacterized protein M6D78_009421 [Vipera latastei]